MAKNVGKVFEQDFKKSIPPDYFHYRLKDDTSGYSGVNNPCDFMIYKAPHLFMLELKSCKGKSIPLDRLRENQVKGLYKSYLNHAIYGGFVINFRDLEETYFLSVYEVVRFINEGGRKSLPVEFCRKYGSRIEQTLKRTRYSYDLGAWLGRYYHGSLYAHNERRTGTPVSRG
jgi:recombination protein U